VKRRLKLSLALWVVFLAVCIALAARARYTTDMSAFLPRSPTPSQQLLVDQLREGVVSRLLLVAIQGAPPEVLAQLSQKLTDALSKATDVAYVSNGDETRLTADGQFLLEHRYLLSPRTTPERFTSSGLREALEETLDLLASPLSPLVSQILPRDPTGEFLYLLDAFIPQGGPNKIAGVWFSADAARALLVIQTRAAGFDLDAQEALLTKVQSQFKSIASTAGATRAEIAITGPAVFAVASRADIKRDVSRISVLAIAAICTLLLAVYRSLSALAIMLLPVVTGALAGIAAVDLAFGSVHGVTLGFGVTLLGEGVDYAIYLLTNAAGRQREHGLAKLWPTLRLGVLTSIVGFGVLLLSDFAGLAQLGLFSITGLIVALTITRWVLPSIVSQGVRIAPIEALGSYLVPLVSRASVLRVPLLVLFIAAAAWLAWRADAIWDDRLESLNPASEEAKRLDDTLRRDVGAPDVALLAVVRGASLQEALERAEGLAARLSDLQKEGQHAGFESPANILPAIRTQKWRQDALPDAPTLQRNLRQAASGLPFQVNTFEPFLREVAATRQGALLTREDLRGTGLALKVDSLLVERRGEWFALLPLRGVRDSAGLASSLQGPDWVHLLNLKQEADALYQGYRRQAMLFALAGAAGVALLLLSALRSFRRAGDVLLPLLAAVTLTSAAFTLGGGQLTMFHLVGLLLVVGVGSNYSLFFERRTLAASEPKRTVTSVTICNASTILGFGLLALAQAPVLHAIGGTVALGTFLTLVFASVLGSRRFEAALTHGEWTTSP
jgi:predicted exporter